MKNENFTYEEIFDKAMNDLKDIWSTVSFAGSPLRVDNIKSWEPETKELFQDYQGFIFKDSILSNNQNGRHFTTFFDYINNGKTLQ